MRICAISDIHFKYARTRPEDAENASLILSFLRQAAGKYDLMVLNGDIFDLWFDWKYTIIRQYFPLLHELASLGEQGCKLVLVSGNHDFWFNGFLTDYLGMEVHADRYSLSADGKKLLFTHGDLHTVNDLRYQLFRRLIRLKGTKLLFSLLHPDLALSVGKAMSRSSRARKLSHSLRAKKGTGLADYARRQLGKFDVVVMGHSHQPQVQALEGGIYANCGDWMTHHSYIELIDGNIELKHYKEKIQ